jgi:hypothetical protein
MNLEIHLASHQAINYTYCPLLLVDVPPALDPLRASLALHLPILSYIPRLCLTRDGIAESLLHQGLYSPQFLLANRQLSNGFFFMLLAPKPLTSPHSYFTVRSISIMLG